MKKISVFVLSLALIVLLVVISCSDNSSDSGDEPIATSWTVMVYGAGNNNLDGANLGTSYIVQDVQDMEKVGSQPGLDIIAMVSSLRLAGGAKYYKVEYHPDENPDQILSPVLEDLGSKDMSNPTQLRNFLNYCKANYPSDKYLLVIDDHGGGWPGSCSDDLGGVGGMLTMPELKSAIAQSELGHVDIVCFHACLMAMAEVAYELRDVADYMTACQFTMPMENVLGANLWLAWLKDNLNASSDQLARKIAEKVYEAAQNKQKTTHFAMIDLSKLFTLGTKVGDLGTYLVNEGAQYWGEVVNAFNQTHYSQYDDIRYVDLSEFANAVKEQEHLQHINLIRNAAESLIATMDEVVPYTNAYFKSGDQVISRSGLNIHFPFTAGQFDSANYVTLEFRNTNWHSFLSVFIPNSGGGGPGEECPTTCAEAGVIQVGQAVTECQFSEGVTQHWGRITLNPGNYRFQLGDFPAGADYDLYTFMQCADFPNNPTGCSGTVVGPEDFGCEITGGVIEIFVLVNAYQPPYGGYTLLITQTGIAEPDNPTIVATE
ncbi:hypothetical protein KKB28_04680 [bacterium]|nr:hypothetical protein [bacterium]